MSEKITHTEEDKKIQKTINTVLRVGFIGLLFGVSYMILSPFLGPLLWGIIIAVAMFPLHKKLSGILGNRPKLSAVLIVLIGLAIIIVPSIFFTSSTVDSLKSVSQQLEDGSLKVPPPDKAVAEWPIIGGTIYDIWEIASKGITDLIVKFEPQLKEYAPSVLSAATGIIMTIVVFIISIIIAGVLLINAKSAEKTAISIFKTLAGSEGEHFAILAGSTIRSVVQGVLGTAIIQAIFIGIGLFLIGFPAAGIVTSIVLFVAIIQLPLILVLIPIIIYVFTYAGTTAAVIFTIWAIIWSASDNVIKPLLMGRGSDIPMLVILLGVIGGMIMGGIIGLFIGAVVLTFAYKVFLTLINENNIDS